MCIFPSVFADKAIGDEKIHHSNIKETQNEIDGECDKTNKALLKNEK